MTYKEKRNATKNIQCFSLIRLVKDVLYEGHDKPFFSFYDGDYFCGYDDNGNIKLSHEINDAQIISCNEYGNEVLNKIVDLITEHKLNYQHIFVQDFNELNESTGWLQHYPNYRYERSLIPLKIYEKTPAYYIAIDKVKEQSWSEKYDEIITNIHIKNRRNPTNEEYAYLLRKDCNVLKLILMKNRGRREFDLFIIDKQRYGGIN